MDGCHSCSFCYTSSATIEKLRIVFSTHDLLERIVTDNGTVFTSDEFESFLKTNGVTHTHTAPYHPALNGLAESGSNVQARNQANPRRFTGDQIGKVLV